MVNLSTNHADAIRFSDLSVWVPTDIPIRILTGLGHRSRLSRDMDGEVLHCCGGMVNLLREPVLLIGWMHRMKVSGASILGTC